MMTTFDLFLHFACGVLATSRLTRLLVWDSYPPSAWLRMKWDDRTHESPWNLLLHCGYCASPWIGLVVLGSFLAILQPDLDRSAFWLLPMIWLGGSYLAAVFMAYDGED